MATPTTTSPNDAYATTETISFIENLKSALAEKKNDLSQKQMKYNNAVSSKNALSEQASTAQSNAAMALSSLEQAETAQKQIDLIADFFSQRTAVTSTMVATAKATATKMYEATEFVGQQGLERIDDILNLTLDYNKKETDVQYQWTYPFVTAVQAASAKGQAALNAAVKATKDSFTTLVSTLQIDYRTRNYYQQCMTYQKMIANLIERLTSEYVLLKIKSDNLNSKLNQVELSLALLDTDVKTASFEVAQLQAEYTAAQKGASYTGSTTTAAASN